MSNSTTKQTRHTLKATAISGRMNQSVSGILKSYLSATYTRSVNASVSRKSLSLAGESKVLDKTSAQPPKLIVQVLDETGKDVTPQPLYQPEPGTGQTKQSKIFAPHDTSWGTLADHLSIGFQTTSPSFAAPFTRSIFGSSSVSRLSQSIVESMNDEFEEPSSKRDISDGLSDVKVWKDEMKDQIKEDTLDNVVDCYLTETETIWLLDMPAVSVSVDSEEAEIIRERNNVYTELCKNKLGNDKYTERSMQTFNGSSKVKEIQTDNITMVEKGTTATSWDIFDSYVSGNKAGEPGIASDGKKATIPEISSVHRLDSTRDQERPTSGVSATSIITNASSTSFKTEMETFVVVVEDKPDPELILQSEKFQQHLLVVEQAILENIYQPKLAAYRMLPVLTEPDGDEGERESQEESSLSPALERLWAFSCELTMGRNVSSMAWNKKNPDLLAVGYGQFDFKDQKPGLFCCWSLKNPTWPQRIFHCESGVTALDFSACNAGQLAVGMHDGSIAIYSVQSKEETPIIDSRDCPNKHVGPVWQVKWIDHEQGPSGEEKGETLISVAADGKISKWFLRKSLDCIDLMKLKRMRDDKKRFGEKGRKTEALVSQQAPGLCCAFHQNKSNIYLTGTEEGHIHKCSSSYNEQFLETYTAHRGPIYKVTWSPFCPDVFLSCSGDWTIQLWTQDHLTPLLCFTSTQKANYDVMWSPRWATVFGAINEDRVEIWDLGANILEPTIVSVASPGVKLTTLLFAKETDCILVGDSKGQISVYKLVNFTVGAGAQVDTLADIIRSTLASQLLEGKRL